MFDGDGAPVWEDGSPEGDSRVDVHGANALTATELFTQKMVKTVSFMLCLFITIKK